MRDFMGRLFFFVLLPQFRTDPDTKLVQTGFLVKSSE